MKMAVGIDMGNKNLKVSGQKSEAHEMPIAFTEIEELDYEMEELSSNIEKVKYNDKYYLVGMNQGNALPQNKGDIAFREQANMFKLLGLARELRRIKKTEGKFYTVTGTPLQDFERTRNDYKELMLSSNKEYEKIIVNDIEYSIKVSSAYVTRQAGCLRTTLGDLTGRDILIVDFGGGTLDVALFLDGSKGEYLTIPFPLNRILEDLGNKLNDYGLGLPRPNRLDSGFLRDMENVVLKGDYKGIRSLKIDSKETSIQDFSNEWLQSRIDTEIDNIKIRLELTDTQAKTVETYFIGGGAKLLDYQLNRNHTFANTKIIETPEFANVETFRAIAEALLEKEEQGDL